MAGTSRSNDWGFPRWRGYGSERGAQKVRLCDRQGCDRPGDCPAPKSPNSPERWYFCEEHAGEYNKGWNFYAGMSDGEVRAAKENEAMTGGRPTWEMKAGKFSREAAAFERAVAARDRASMDALARTLLS